MYYSVERSKPRCFYSAYKKETLNSFETFELFQNRIAEKVEFYNPVRIKATLPEDT